MSRGRAILPAALLSLGMIAGPALGEGDHHFHLHGGYFYGPGPIKPDTKLPDGDIHGIVFDTGTWRGEAKFRPGETRLSDGKTRVNANIDAGRLGIGADTQAKSFWLTAVEGGPNQGTEKYRFDEAMNFVWQVDLALDPGFLDGIIRVDDFRLTTGWVQVPRSLQSIEGAPDGYDRAGSLSSGAYLVGRVGDFDRDGFLDGVLVASANVPMQADMLPGAPVGNLRGFTTDIPVAPLTAAEMTLAGVDNMRPIIDRLLAAGDRQQLVVMLADIGGRLEAASHNYEDAFLKADPQHKAQLRQIGWRIDRARKFFFIPWAFLSSYDDPAAKPGESVQDSTRLGFDVVHELVPYLKDIRMAAGGAMEKTR
jgi:hypothetical protein